MIQSKDKHRINSIPYPAYIKHQDKIISSLGLTYSSYRDLMAIVTSYVSSGTGLRPYQLISYFGKTDGVYRTLYARLSILQDKGLISKLNSHYIPTQKAIQLINSITI